MTVWAFIKFCCSSHFSIQLEPKGSSVKFFVCELLLISGTELRHVWYHALEPSLDQLESGLGELSQCPWLIATGLALFSIFFHHFSLTSKMMFSLALSSSGVRLCGIIYPNGQLGSRRHAVFGISASRVAERRTLLWRFGPHDVEPLYEHRGRRELGSCDHPVGAHLSLLGSPVSILHFVTWPKCSVRVIEDAVFAWFVFSLTLLWMHKWHVFHCNHFQPLGEREVYRTKNGVNKISTNICFSFLYSRFFSFLSEHSKELCCLFKVTD